MILVTIALLSICLSAHVALPAPDLDLMVAASLKDIPSDESVSGDDDDPDLLVSSEH